MTSRECVLLRDALKTARRRTDLACRGVHPTGGRVSYMRDDTRDNNTHRSLGGFCWWTHMLPSEDTEYGSVRKPFDLRGSAGISPRVTA